MKVVSSTSSVDVIVRKILHPHPRKALFSFLKDNQPIKLELQGMSGLYLVMMEAGRVKVDVGVYAEVLRSSPDHGAVIPVKFSLDNKYGFTKHRYPL